MGSKFRQYEEKMEKQSISNVMNLLYEVNVKTFWF